MSRNNGCLRPEVVETLENYLRCGILSYGFARIKCADCQKEFLLAFSCKGRYFCPACHQRRVQEFSLFLTEHLLEEVAHRQIVFSLPKMLRIYFLYNRSLLPKLSHCGWETKVIYRDNKLNPSVGRNFEAFDVLDSWRP